uniref:Uncharacterized protein n=1 Tax=Ceratitis capitata TaxID=7213 RepID=W8B5P8_CERCA
MLRSSRTYFSLTADQRAKFTGSTPDLSRSVPTTPIFRKFAQPKMRSDSLALDRAPKLREERFDEDIVELRQAHGLLTPRFTNVAAAPTSRHDMIAELPPIEDAGQMKAISVQTPTMGASRQVETTPRPAMTSFRSTMPAPPPPAQSRNYAMSSEALNVRNSSYDADLVSNRFQSRENAKFLAPAAAATTTTGMSANATASNNTTAAEAELRQQAQNLLYSSSFAIKRPSLYGSGRSSLGSSQSLYDIYESNTHFRNEPNTSAAADMRLSTHKASALLDSIDPSLRASIKLGSVQEVNSVVDSEVKYTIPRVGTIERKSKSKKSVNSSLEEDSVA